MRITLDHYSNGYYEMNVGLANDDSWFYNGRYYDFVIDYLNKDYFKLAGGSDKKLEHKKRVEEYNKKLQENMERTGIEHTFFTPKITEFEQAIKSDLENVDFNHFKKMIDLIFVNKIANNSLTAAQKYYAYSSAFNDNFFIYNANIQFESVTTHCGDKGISTASWHSDRNRNLDLIFEKVCNLIYENDQKYIPFETYSFNSYRDVLSYLTSKMIGYNCVVKICENCGKYFVPLGRSSTMYCDNKAPNDPFKTCREYVKYIKYLNKTQSDVSTKLYKQIYNSKANKVKRCDNKHLKDDLEQFMLSAKHWKSDVKTKKKSESEYIEWLKSYKKRCD